MEMLIKCFKNSKNDISYFRNKFIIYAEREEEGVPS
jgi:hypothetical protein